jgi:hypothetical protein
MLRVPARSAEARSAEECWPEIRHSDRKRRGCAKSRYTRSVTRLIASSSPSRHNCSHSVTLSPRSITYLTVRTAKPATGCVPVLKVEGRRSISGQPTLRFRLFLGMTAVRNNRPIVTGRLHRRPSSCGTAERFGRCRSVDILRRFCQDSASLVHIWC